MILGSQLGKRFETATLDNYDTSECNENAKNVCASFIKNGGAGILLIGPVGVGKTHLLAAVANALGGDKDGHFDGDIWVQPSSKRVQYWPMLDLAAELRNDALEGRIVTECKMCDLLVIDDLGREKESDYLSQTFEQIIDYRYRMNAPVAVSTNLTKREITQRCGQHTMSRWLQCCSVVEMSGDDYRLKEA